MSLGEFHKVIAVDEEIARGALFILQNDYYDGRILEIDGGLRI